MASWLPQWHTVQDRDQFTEPLLLSVLPSLKQTFRIEKKKKKNSARTHFFFFTDVWWLNQATRQEEMVWTLETSSISQTSQIASRSPCFYPKWLWQCSCEPEREPWCHAGSFSLDFLASFFHHETERHNSGRKCCDNSATKGPNNFSVSCIARKC